MVEKNERASKGRGAGSKRRPVEARGERDQTA